jgi:hypothetical protein
MSETSETRAVGVTAWVTRSLAKKIQDLAEAGDRSISREAAAALRAHVALANPAVSAADLQHAEAVEPRAPGGEAP